MVVVLFFFHKIVEVWAILVFVGISAINELFARVEAEVSFLPGLRPKRPNLGRAGLGEGVEL